MREQFPDSWSSAPKEDDGLVWKHESGRVTLYEGDMLKKRSELVNTFDAVYDKDSFGALTKDLRPAFCERLSDYTKDDATLYIEVKNKLFGRGLFTANASLAIDEPNRPHPKENSEEVGNRYAMRR
ncbi:MAG: hypothetical protein SGBAC_005405 [Bacillariaceae sp.]